MIGGGCKTAITNSSRSFTQWLPANATISLGVPACATAHGAADEKPAVKLILLWSASWSSS
jgi:hypothetical protein